MIACLALLLGLTACEDATKPQAAEVAMITSPSPGYVRHHPHADVGVATISGEGPVLEGDSIQLIAMDHAGNEVDAQWSSSAHKIASVSATGMVRGLVEGEAIITAKTKSRRASALIRVTAAATEEPDDETPGEEKPGEEEPPAVASVGVMPVKTEIEVGDTIHLTVTLKDAEGNVLTDREVTWSSSATGVATVSKAGVVIGGEAGVTTITATSEGQSGTAEITVRAASEPPPSIGGPLPVFPGAEGAGTLTPAGRGGRVIRVTNLNESGPGSLRAAVEASGPRIVIFDVSGMITLSKHLNIDNPYLTLAGQTAPSPGITIRGATLQVRTHDVLIQHLRVRVGDDPSGPNPGSRDGIRVFASGVRNVVIDHVSVSWSIDELISTYNHTDVTIRNSIFSEGLSQSIHPNGEHSKGVFIAEGSHRLTLVGNLIAHNRDRNPAIKGNTSVIIANNVIYNWGNGTAIPIWDSNTDPTYKPVLASIVGNVFINGPSTPSRGVCFKVYETVAQGTQIYLSDNQWAKGSSDPWSIGEIKTSLNVKASRPPVWTELTVRPSREVEAWVLASAGARPADRDAVDERIIGEVRTRTGRIIDNPGQVGGWPTLRRNTRVLELPANPHGIDIGTGYTNIERWLHKLAAEVEGR